MPMSTPAHVKAIAMTVGPMLVPMSKGYSVEENERTRKSHNEADVWCVAAEFVLPMAVAVRCASVADACRLQPHAPPSLLEAILERTWARELFLRASIG